MTSAVLTLTLDDELDALFHGEATACLVCDEPVEPESGRVECRACGSVVETGATM